ncbi:hypothetical protein ACMFMF_006373 [Clarireedia jacksonii]
MRKITDGILLCVIELDEELRRAGFASCSCTTAKAKVSSDTTLLGIDNRPTFVFNIKMARINSRLTPEDGCDDSYAEKDLAKSSRYPASEHAIATIGHQAQETQPVDKE